MRRLMPSKAQQAIATRVVLEFYLNEQATLEAKYQELIDYGYQGFTGAISNVVRHVLRHGQGP